MTAHESVDALYQGASARSADQRRALVPSLDSRVQELWQRDGRDAGFESLARVIHPRVRTTLRYLNTLAPGTEPPLRELAELAGLSPDRFTHVFAESLGMPLRTYLLRRKLQHAVMSIAAGQALAAAAVEAGFADAAHMSRTFRRVFGTTPSELRRHTRQRERSSANEAGTAK